MLRQGVAEQGSLDSNGGRHPRLLHQEARRGKMGNPPQKIWLVIPLSLSLSLIFLHQRRKPDGLSESLPKELLRILEPCSLLD
jgi:hypothetical protein